MPSSENHSRWVENCCVSLAKSKFRAAPTQRPISARTAMSASPPVDSRERGSTHTTRAAASGTTMRSVVSTAQRTTRKTRARIDTVTVIARA